MDSKRTESIYSISIIACNFRCNLLVTLLVTPLLLLLLLFLLLLGEGERELLRGGEEKDKRKILQYE